MTIKTSGGTQNALQPYQAFARPLAEFLIRQSGDADTAVCALAASGFATHLFPSSIDAPQ